MYEKFGEKINDPEQMERMENYLWEIENQDISVNPCDMDALIDIPGDEAPEWDEDTLPSDEREQYISEEPQEEAIDVILEYEEDPLTELEIELDSENNPDDPDAPMSFQIRREQINLAAVEHLAKIARTVQEFDVIIREMDRLDRNRERRERYHEICKENLELDSVKAKDHYICPEWMNDPVVRQLRSGQFLDSFYDCPYEMHQLVADPDLSRMVSGLKESQKETLFYLALRLYSTSQVACIKEMTDRNVRKIRDTYTKKLQKQLFEYLQQKCNQGEKLSLREKEFIEKYSASVKENGAKARVRAENKYPVRGKKEKLMNAV